MSNIKKKKSFPKRLILIIFVLMLVIGAGGLFLYWQHLSAEKNKLNKLAGTVENTAESTKNDEDTDVSPLPQYEQLYKENPDLFGWIKIDDTMVDYPVMYTPEEPEKYLHANFDGEYSEGGLPFMEDACTNESDNLVIYGHNMIDGSMFRTLFQYEDKEYWEEHPIIKFDTVYEEQEYEVMSAFYDRVYYKNEDVFKFYQFIDAENEEDYKDAIDNFKEKQIYDTGVEAEYGDQLITLVTCSYHTDNGRFVVVARKVSE